MTQIALRYLGLIGSNSYAAIAQVLSAFDLGMLRRTRHTAHAFPMRELLGMSQTDREELLDLVLQFVAE
jgi:hypothetical protein